MRPPKPLKIRPEFAQFWVENRFLYLCVLGLSLICVRAYFLGSSYTFHCAALLFALLVYALYRWLVLRAHVWQIYPEQIIQRTGLFTLVTNQVEMYRVIDYQEKQSFLQRFFGVKTLILKTRDRTCRELKISGIPSNYHLMEYIRTQVEQCKKKNRIYEVTNN